MRRVQFVEPNFEAEVEDLDGRHITEVHNASSEEELRLRLNERVTDGLIKAVGKIKPVKFSVWLEKAAAEAAKCNAAKKAGVEYEFRDAIWGALKGHLITLFRRKCAYCETRLTTDSWGDVEHYRPKGKVTDEQRVEVTLPNGEPHPGYYWQAYDYQNYVPSCSKCNGPRGKLNKFPVAGTRACCPEDDLSKEEPLLLNPLVDEPRDWLTFVPSVGAKDVGTVTSTKPRGISTRAIVWLNRDDLVEERREAQGFVRLKAKAAVAAEDVPGLVALVNQYREGTPQYSAALLAELIDYCKKMRFDIDVT